MENEQLLRDVSNPNDPKYAENVEYNRLIEEHLKDWKKYRFKSRYVGGRQVSIDQIPEEKLPRSEDADRL